MLRILLVEDEPDIASVTAVVLEDAGYHVTVASDGREGLDIALQERPELIITDFMMPRLSGLEMIQRLRDAGFTGPIVLSTSVPEDHLPHERRRHDAYLCKPYGMRQLLATVEALRKSLGGAAAV